MIRPLLLIAVVLFLVFQAAASLPQRVAIHGPYVVTEGQRPAPKWLIRIEQNADNRLAYFLLMDEGLAPNRADAVRRSQEELDGESATLRYVSWATLPAGEFRLWVLLNEQTGEVARASVPLTVLARF